MAARRDLHLSDPRAMRALAHPVRLRLLGQLRVGGPQSVGMLAAAMDESPGSVSFHVGVLARHGFVEGAPELARDRRERWWRAAHDRTTWEPREVLGDPERWAASDALRRAIWQRYVQLLEDYLRAEPALDPAWVQGTASSDTQLHLTPAQLGELRADLEALATRWEARSDPGGDGTALVQLIYHAFRRPS